MALINCPECNKEISDKAPACPSCGSPITSAEPKYQKGDYIPYTDQEVQVMLSKKKTTSHLLHLILCIPTVGLWLLIWILVAASNGTENAKIDRMIAKGKKFKGSKDSPEAQGLM
jgi:uncharacterized membrane protein YvbJ